MQQQATFQATMHCSSNIVCVQGSGRTTWQQATLKLEGIAIADTVHFCSCEAYCSCNCCLYVCKFKSHKVLQQQSFGCMFN